MRAIDLVRASLEYGLLVRERNGWIFVHTTGARFLPVSLRRRQHFSNQTIKTLIEDGEAVREGDIVRAA